MLWHWKIQTDKYGPTSNLFEVAPVLAGVYSSHYNWVNMTPATTSVLFNFGMQNYIYVVRALHKMAASVNFYLFVPGVSWDFFPLVSLKLRDKS